jgi:hypothetical protein
MRLSLSSQKSSQSWFNFGFNLGSNFGAKARLSSLATVGNLFSICS